MDTDGDQFKSGPTQLWEMLSCLVRLQLHPGEYRQFGLGRQGVPIKAALDFLPGRDYWDRVQPRLNDPVLAQRLLNKAWFSDHCALRGLPSPEVVAVIDRQGVFHVHESRTRHTLASFGRFILERDLGDLVVKPVAGWKGRGVFRVERQARSDRFVVISRGGTSREVSSGDDWRSAVPRLVASGSNALVVQRRERQHPFLEELTPGGASTVRVMTLRGRDANVAIPFAVLRLARRGYPTDNISGGGILVSADAVTGVLGMGRFRVGKKWIATPQHPDTGRAFAGETFPEWGACLKLAEDAALSVPGLNLVGWDILLTPEGPMLLEGNHDAGPELQTLGGELLRPGVRPVFSQWGLDFPTDMPRATLRGLVRGVKMVLSPH